MKEFKKHHRCIGSIYNYANKYGLSEIKGVWLEEELMLLKKYYPTMGIKCCIFLPNHTKDQVHSKAVKLNLKSNNIQYSTKWTEEETNILITYYPTEGKYCLDRLPNKTLQSMQNKVHNLKLTYIGDYNKEWSTEEDTIFKDNYEEYGPEGVSKLLKEAGFNRSPAAVITRNKIFKLNYKYRYENSKLTKWTKDLKEILISRYSACGSNIPELLVVFTEKQIRDKANILNLHRNRQVIHCIETNLYFNTAKEAAIKYDIKTPGKITEVCKTGKAAGKLPNGTKLHWEYVNEEEK